MEIRQGGYLYKHLEEPQGEERGADNGLNLPIIEGLSIDYNVQNGLLYEKDDSSVELGFDKMPDDTVMDIISHLHQARIKAGDAEKDVIDKLLSIYNSPTYVLNKYRLKKGENTLDFDELKANIPNIQITFSPKAKIKDCFSGQLKKGSEEVFSDVLVAGDITKIETILAMLHEIGHHANPTKDNLAALSRLVKRESVSAREAEQILESERTAWAFALWKIKPFLDANNRDCAVRSIHENSLKSYSEGIREQLAPNWRLILVHIEEYLADLI